MKLHFFAVRSSKKDMAKINHSILKNTHKNRIIDEIWKNKKINEIKNLRRYPLTTKM